MKLLKKLRMIGLSCLLVMSTLFLNLSEIQAKVSSVYTTKQYESGYKSDTGKDIIRLRVYSKEGGIPHYDPSNPTGRRWGQWAFCVEHGKTVNNGESSGDFSSLSERYKQVARLAYLGFYSHSEWLPGITTNELNLGYARTQMLIWQFLGQANQNYAMDSGYANWKKEIMNQYNKWDVLPSFQGTTLQLEVGQSQTVTDSQGVLQYYKSFNYTKNGVSFSHTAGQNTMKISVSNDCTSEQVVIDQNEAQKAGMSKYENTQKTTVALLIEDTAGEQDKICTPGYNDPQYLSLKVNVRLNGQLQISKKDNKGHDVAGVGFQISYHSDMSDPIGTYQTGSNGKVTIENLKPQTVYIQEVSVPPHLILDKTIHQVDIRANETSSFIATNNWKQGYIQVVKKDADTGKVVQKAGTEFEVYRSNHDKIATIVTNEQGIAKTGLLDYGTYYIKETKAPEDYLIKVEVSDDVNVSENGKTYEIVVSNRQVKGAVHITKEDDHTGSIPQGDATLKGAKYGIYARKDILDPSHDGTVLFQSGEKVSEMITDEKGQGQVDDLYLGQYYIKEIEASYGYNLDETEYDFELTYENQNVAIVTKNVTVYERVISQAFSIIKISSDETGEAELLKGAEFTIKWKKDVDKQGWEKAPIAKNADGKTASLLVTDERGYAQSDRLPLGEYVVRETKTPHNKYPVADFIVEVTKDSSEPIPYRVFNDKSFHSVLSIVKEDAETGKIIKIAGAKFKIKNLDTNEYFGYWQWTPLPHYVSEWTTTEEGTIMTGEVLPVGRYALEEIESPDGYLLSQEPVFFEIDSGIAYETLPDGQTPLITVKKSDVSVKGQLNVQKRGEVLTRFDEKAHQFLYEERGLPNAEYHIIAHKDILDPSHDGTILYKQGTLVEKLITDQTGKAVSQKLPLGSYEVVEVKAPDGMVINPQKQIIELKYKDQNTPLVFETVSFINQRQKVEASLFKQDSETKIGLSDAQFDLKVKKDIHNYDGDVIVKANTIINKYVSNQQGMIDLKSMDLPLNCYFQLIETKAPDGYELDETPIEINTKYQGQDIEKVTISKTKNNQATRVDFSKTDVTTGQELPGNHMVIFEKGHEEHVCASWVSQDKPYTVKNLKTKTRYVLKETYAVKGFSLAKDIEFELDVDGQVYVIDEKGQLVKASENKIIMENDLIKGRLEWDKTGEIFMHTIMGQTEHGQTKQPVWEISRLLQSEITIYAREDITLGNHVTYYHKDEKVQTLESDLDPIQSKDLLVGRYYYVETKTPHGYVTDDKKHYFEIEDQQSSHIQVVSSTLHNQRAKVDINMRKVLEKQDIFKNEKAYQDIVFGIFAREDIYDYRGNVAIENGTMIYTSGINQDGKLTLADTFDLPHGVYYLKELTTNGQYILNDKEYDFEIAYQGGDVSYYIISLGYDGVIKNDLIKGSVQLLKKAYVKSVKEQQFVEEEQFLKGAKYGIATDKAFKNIVQTAVTDENGRILFQNLEKGTYYVRELEAPQGFFINDSIYTVHINEHEQVITVEAYDEQILTDIQVHKIDSQTKEAIVMNDFEFTLYSDPYCREVLDVAKANQSTGMATFSSLPKGTYYIKETKAPLGYQLSQEVKKVVVDEKLNGYGYIHSFLYANKKTPLKVKTGDDIRWAMASVSLVTSGCAIYLLGRKKKKVS